MLGSFRRAVGMLTVALLVGGVLAPPSSARSVTTEGPHVVPIAWEGFGRTLPPDDQAELSRAILLNTNRYALMTWFPEEYEAQDGEYLDLGGTGEGHIRPPGSEALALATSLATGAYDEEAVGFDEEHARDVTRRLVASIASYHKANRRGGWGDAWQSALWAFNAGFAGWLIWDDLSAADRELVERMVVSEADRFLYYEVPYYQDPDGNVITPGDTKAEENAWNAAFLNLAVSMMPKQPNRAVWQDKAIELMISAYSRPSDLSNDSEVNGKPLSEWLGGSNIFDDGTMVNHGFIHPDYFTSIANSAGSPVLYALAGLPSPAAALFNADVVYGALVDHEFSAPPYDPPGGTIYVRGEDGSATADVYYPQGNDWGTSRRLHFLLLDTLADLLGFDDRVSIPAAEWATAHATRAFEMQSRFEDGRTYGDPSEDTYSGREQWVALLAARTYMTHWIMHNTDVQLTNRAYPVSPRDYPGASVEIEAAAKYVPGEATPLTLHVQSRSEAPLLRLSTELWLPDGWTAVRADESSDRSTVRPGEAVSMTWLVTPGPDVPEGSARLRATARYRHYGRERSLNATAHVEVPPGQNLALGAPVEVSSVLRAGAEGEKAVDGLFTDDSRWISALDDPTPWIVIDLGEPADLSSVYIYSGYLQSNNDPTSTLKDFTVEVHTADGWEQVAEIVDNTAHKVTVTGLDVRGDRVRLEITDPSGSSVDVARVFEVEAYQLPAHRLAGARPHPQAVAEGSP